MTEIDSNIYTDSNFIEDIATKVIDKLLKKRMYILATKSLSDKNEINKKLSNIDKINKKILCDIVNKDKLLVDPRVCKKKVYVDPIQGVGTSTPGHYSYEERKGGSKKRTVIIKSNILPKTVKGLKTRKKLLKKRIKKAEKKVKLSKNRIIRLK
tara:strand:- start:279 stop:740 length:462 start_codon:yes stop_codon:yes gene_type:complete